MATPSIIGIRRGDHWHGAFVGYDGGLDQLGTKILDLVIALRGDLSAVWSRIAAAPDGWRYAFSEPYEPGFNTEYFATGRAGGPLLTDQDPFVRMNAVYWYIFDLEARALDIYEVPHRGGEWLVVERIVFSEDGHPHFQLRAKNAVQPGGQDAPYSMSVDTWVAAMDGAYQDHRPELVEATAKTIESILGTRLPFAGERTALASDAITFVDDVKTVNWPTTLVPEGFACPLKLFINGGPDPSACTSILEHSEFLLFPRRVMSDGARCEAALRTALARIEIEIGLDKVPVDESLAAFSAMFPFHILDAKLDPVAQDAAINAEVEKAFTTVK